MTRPRGSGGRLRSDGVRACCGRWQWGGRRRRGGGAHGGRGRRRRGRGPRRRRCGGGARLRGRSCRQRGANGWLPDDGVVEEALAGPECHHARGRHDPGPSETDRVGARCDPVDLVRPRLGDIGRSDGVAGTARGKRHRHPPDTFACVVLDRPVDGGRGNLHRDHQGFWLGLGAMEQQRRLWSCPVPARPGRPSATQAHLPGHRQKARARERHFISGGHGQARDLEAPGAQGSAALHGEARGRGRHGTLAAAHRDQDPAGRFPAYQLDLSPYRPYGRR